MVERRQACYFHNPSAICLFVNMLAHAFQFNFNNFFPYLLFHVFFIFHPIAIYHTLLMNAELFRVLRDFSVSLLFKTSVDAFSAYAFLRSQSYFRLALF